MKKLILALSFLAYHASAQQVYFNDGSVYYLQEGEQIFITDQEWVFTVEKGGYMRGLFEFYRILPLCEYYEPNDGLTFGGSAPAAPDCVSAHEAEEEEEDSCGGLGFGPGC